MEHGAAALENERHPMAIHFGISSGKRRPKEMIVEGKIAPSP
jgi:hypothetical protein